MILNIVRSAEKRSESGMEMERRYADAGIISGW